MSTAAGREAEEQAARFLARRGWRVLDRNVRGGRGELDIVARKGEMLAFIEVKRRDRREDGLLAVHADKQARLRSAAQAWLARHPDCAALACRFDLILVRPGRFRARIEHLTDAFR